MAGLDEGAGAGGQWRLGRQALQVAGGDAAAQEVVGAKILDDRDATAKAGVKALWAPLALAGGAELAQEPLVEDQFE